MTAESQARVRILHVIYSLDPGGAENVVASIVAHSDAKRFEIEVASLTGDGAVADRIREMMTTALPLDVPIAVDIAHGRSWLDCK